MAEETYTTIDPVVTNTPRAGETPEQTAARTDRRGNGSAAAPTSTVRSIEEMVEQARARAVQYVMGISEETHVTLGKRIDELDNLRARIKSTESALQFYVGEFAKSNAEARILAEHMKKDIEDATVPFAKTPTATITQDPKGEA